MHKISSSLTILALPFILLINCAHLENIKMKWISTGDSGNYSPGNLANFVGHTYKLDTIIDCRPQKKDTIIWIGNGPHTRDNRPIYWVTTQTNIPSFIMTMGSDE
jgi:hypothetical protein